MIVGICLVSLLNSSGAVGENASSDKQDGQNNQNKESMGLNTFDFFLNIFRIDLFHKIKAK
jgi:hypothetical protein